jgi:putative ATPase
MVDLFETRRALHRASVEPLASRMRPRTLDEFAGQRHILGPGSMLRRMIEADRVGSVLFHGPPGTGKTTLAELIATTTRAHFERGNAAAVGVKDVRFVLDAARARLEQDGRRTIFFLDEIHRFNKAQQDVLLGDVERGVITLIGATTENPYFAVNSALVSRSQVFALEPLPPEEVVEVLRRAIADEERGYGGLDLEVEEDALQHLATQSDGDARRALTALEIAVLSETRASTLGVPASAEESATTHDPGVQALHSGARITLAVAEHSIQHKAVVYDRAGDEHYDAISAFIKSVRGSDPDAAVYWLAKMLVAGEDPMFIARRIAILASEDIGNADPRGLLVANAAYEITHRIGLPECRITLAQAAIYLATAPKSNASYAAIGAAMQDVRERRTQPVPKYLRSIKTKKDGQTYAYAHDSETGFVDQDYLGVTTTFYEPTDRGFERRIAEYLAWVDGQRAMPRRPAEGVHPGRGAAEVAAEPPNRPK